MKFIYFIPVFILLTVTVQAQKSIDYVSFFPTSGVVHNKVSLVQDQESFDYNSDFDENIDPSIYQEKEGGLILGAADDAVVKINSINILNAKTGGSPFAFKNFNIDNVIRVYSTGTIREINIGNDGVCKGNPERCRGAFISADQLIWPLRITNYNEDMKLNVNISVANLATLTRVNILKTDGKAYTVFLPGLKVGDTLGWRNLRIDGTGVCRKYLVLNPPGLGDCREPDDSNND